MMRGGADDGGGGNLCFCKTANIFLEQHTLTSNIYCKIFCVSCNCNVYNNSVIM